MISRGCLTLVLAMSLSGIAAADVLSDAVGASVGEFRVDETGAAVYSMGIWVPPGTAGVVPDLSLNYHSRGGNGPLGKGWSIGGQSAITRCARTREHGDFYANGQPVDGSFPGVNFGPGDAFCLDGQRLLLVSGDYGANQAEYRPELDPYTRVRSFGGVAGTPGYSGPHFFTVERRDGSVAHYGNSLDSRIEIAPCGAGSAQTCTNLPAVAYALNRTQDRSGNFVDYAYDEFASQFGAEHIEYVLTRVRYTGKLSGSTVVSAPYAEVEFVYIAPLASSYRSERSLQFGKRFSQTRALGSILVRDQLGTQPRILRRYQMDYGAGAGASGSRYRLLRSVTECRDLSTSACYRPTTFKWTDEGTGAVTGSLDTADTINSAAPTNNLKSQRLGDVDGDGQLDLVWFRDDSAACTALTPHRLMVSFADRSNGALTYTSTPATGSAVYCTGLTTDGGELDSAWTLFDWNGDGRDDLIIADNNGVAGARWHVYPSLGRANAQGLVFDFSADLINITIPVADDSQDQAQFGDFNGDGLLDIIYPSGSEQLSIRFLERKFASGQPVGFGYSDPALPVQLNFALGECGAGTGFTCNLGIYSQNVAAFGVANDLTGDGRADLVLRVRRSTNAAGTLPPITVRTDEAIRELYGRTPVAFESILFFAFAMDDRVNGVQRVKQYGNRLYTDPLDGTVDPRQFQFADFNGDGLADLLYQQDRTSDDYSFSINLGTGFQGSGTTAATGMVSDIPNREHLSLIDVTGDGAADLVYPGSTGVTCVGGGLSTRRWRYRSWFADRGSMADLGHFDAAGTGTSPENAAFNIPGNGACADAPDDWRHIWADVDGDGHADYLRLARNGTPRVYSARAAVGKRFRPRDSIEEIRNGYGALTRIDYQPLVNKAIYRRAQGSRLDPLPDGSPQDPSGVRDSIGRGSLVYDLQGSMMVVARARSSAPTLLDPNAESSIWYRYAGAKMQMGGRGLLGFAEMLVIDGNPVDGAHIATLHRYFQDFPYIGMAAQTAKYRRSGTPSYGSPELDACALNIEASGYSCYQNLALATDLAHPAPDGSWQLVQFAGNVPACKGGGNNSVCVPPNPNPAPNGSYCVSEPFVADRSFVPTGTPQPIFPFLVQTQELQYDVPSSGSSAGLLSQKYASFCYEDANGNLTRSIVSHQTADGTTVLVESTLNVYQDNPATWTLGRLVQSQVKHTRGTETKLRVADFGYETATGYLKSEQVQKGSGGDQELWTYYDLDAYGNRTASYTCSATTASGAPMTEAMCRNQNLIQHRPQAPDGSATTAVHRYARTLYDNLGRYPVETRQLYFNPNATNQWSELASLTVQARDEFGNATQETHINGLVRWQEYGLLGRLRRSQDSSGSDRSVFLRWCGSGANEVSCPTGTIFRIESRELGGATTWSYHDLVGRERLQVAQTFNVNNPQLNLSATCSGHDAHGRVIYTSDPFFIDTTGRPAGDPPEFVAGVDPCRPGGLIRPGTTQSYDSLGRVRSISTSDGATESHHYAGFTATARDPLSREASASKNVLGEVVVETQANPSNGAANGMSVSKFYDAQGNLLRVERNAGGGVVISTATYDVLGRKASDQEPGIGLRQYRYNAAGELIRVTDAKGQRIEMDYDALGRMWQRRSGPLSAFGSGDVVFQSGFEAGGSAPSGLLTDRFEYDTANNGRGQLAVTERTGFGLPTWRQVLSYDALGRLSTRSTLLDGNTQLEQIEYDALGRLWRETDISGAFTQNVYGPRGHLQGQIYFDANATRVQSPNLRTVNDVLFEILEHNARGQVTREWRAVNAGNPGFNIVRGYNTQRGWLTSLCTSTGTGTGCDVQQWGYEYNLAGQVRERREGGGLRVETFGYDGLARLGSITRSGSGISAGSSTISYDDHGNLCSRFGQSYIYDGQDGCSPGGPQDPSKSPYAVSQVGDVLYQYDANGNVRLVDAAGTAQDLSIDYDPLDQAVALTRGVGAASDLRVLYSYGADRSRIKRIDSVGSPLSPTLTTTRYIGRVERITEPSGVVETRRELGVAVYSQRSDAGTLTTKSYVFTDGLGSVDAIRVIAGNAPLQPRPSYDVHGARRDAVTWQAPGAAPSVTRKGFTGHQHIDSLGLIHMGGRLYDPGIGRFLQADPYIDAGTQGLNRYSYVLNDPLTRTDPTGYLSTRQWGQLFTMAISIAATGGGAALVGLSGWQGYAYAAGMGFMQGAVQSPSLKGAAWGAVSGLTFHGIGSYFDSAAWAHRGGDLAAELTHTGYAAKVMAHAVAGGTLSHLQGGKFGSSFAAAGLSQAFAPAIDEINGGDAVARIQRATLSALIGGTASALSGGKFANGAVTAAMARLLNDEMHWDGVLEKPTYKQAFGDRARRLMKPVTAAADAASDSWAAQDGILPTVMGTLASTINSNNIANTTWESWIGALTWGAGKVVQWGFTANGGRHIFYSGAENQMLARGLEGMGRAGTIWSTPVGGSLLRFDVQARPVWIMASIGFSASTRSAITYTQGAKNTSIWMQYEEPILRFMSKFGLEVEKR